MSREGQAADAGDGSPDPQAAPGDSAAVGDPDSQPDPGSATVGPSVRALDNRLREGLREVEQHMPTSWQARLRRFRERIRSHTVLDTAWRMGVFTLGISLVAAGLVMFVVPGPGFATVILGLAVLGSEFAWASRALDPVKAAARRASEAALDPRKRRRNLVLAGIVGVLAALAVTMYLRAYGLTLGPVLGLVEALMAWLRGLFA